MIEILNVEKLLHDQSAVRGCELDLPEPGGTSPFHDFTARGWVVGELGPVTAVSVHANDPVAAGRSLARGRVGLDRPDIARAVPGAPWAADSGFEIAVSTLGLAQEFELTVSAGVGEHRDVPLAAVRGRRTPLTTDFQPTLQPLLVTSLGRSGSTWLMRLLNNHAGVVSYRPLEFESRVATAQ